MTPAKVQMGNTDLKARVLSRGDQTGRHRWVGPEGISLPVLPPFDLCVLVVCLTCLLMQVSVEMIWLSHPCVLGAPRILRAGTQ